ncbi:MAG: hypothetical protein FWD32_00355 [Firmicutes bacterium]|nr:hypothetical protein [Bacillota bacterium]
MAHTEQEMKEVIKTIPLPFVKTFIEEYRKRNNEYTLENFGEAYEIVSWLSSCSGGTCSMWWSVFENVCRLTNCELDFLDFFKRLSGDEKELFQMVFAEYLEELSL